MPLDNAQWALELRVRAQQLACDESHVLSQAMKLHLLSRWVAEATMQPGIAAVAGQQQAVAQQQWQQQQHVPSKHQQQAVTAAAQPEQQRAVLLMLQQQQQQQQTQRQAASLQHKQVSPAQEEEMCSIQLQPLPNAGQPHVATGSSSAAVVPSSFNTAAAIVAAGAPITDNPSTQHSESAAQQVPEEGAEGLSSEAIRTLHTLIHSGGPWAVAGTGPIDATAMHHVVCETPGTVAISGPLLSQLAAPLNITTAIPLPDFATSAYILQQLQGGGGARAVAVPMLATANGPSAFPGMRATTMLLHPTAGVAGAAADGICESVHQNEVLNGCFPLSQETVMSPEKGVAQG
eukprot:jgi/Chrzof1/9459/Cz04g03260.t1